MSTYTKTTFVNGTTPAINDTELNKLGQGIADAHSEIDQKVSKTGGDAMSGVHTYTDATLYWSRSSKWASVTYPSGGGYPNELIITVGPNATDELRVVNNATGSILRINGNQIDAYKWVNVIGYPAAQFRGGGKRIFAQTGDPGSNAEEGDVWVGA